jgi:hypothetical protein
MNRLIYIETSIPSFYFETRPGAQKQAHREWTREWRDVSKWQDRLVSSIFIKAQFDKPVPTSAHPYPGFTSPAQPPTSSTTSRAPWKTIRLRQVN